MILALFAERGDDPASWLRELGGIFAFVLYDAEEDRYLVARDPVGVMPLYLGHDADDVLYVASRDEGPDRPLSFDRGLPPRLLPGQPPG